MRIGITGSIGSGKSLVLNYLKSKGYEVFDADKINAELLDEKEVIEDIEKILDIKFIDGRVDKRVMANIIFNDQNKRLALNQYLHPLIKDHIIKKTKHLKLSFVEVPLLYEAKFEDIFDKIFVVYASEAKILDNLKRRGSDINEAKKRLSSQISNEEKCKLADFVLDNNDDILSLYQRMDEILKEILLSTRV